jgi:16S rRNA (guanine527-N7)-methyltransferase
VPDAAALSNEQRAGLLAVLGRARRLGFLGPGSVSGAVDHAVGFLQLMRPASLILDLGSGGGVPGLVIALALGDVHVVLLDASERRTDVLLRAVAQLEVADRVEVVTARAEEAGRRTRWRGQIDSVVSRGFGAPSATAECAAPFLRVGGQLVVSEPPEPDVERWPPTGLALVGLGPERRVAGYVSFQQIELCPPRFPRRAMRPPLFELVSRDTR